MDVEELISEEGFNVYVQNLETRLRNQNFRNGNFYSSNMCDKAHQLLKTAPNLNQEVYLGLIQSFIRNKTNRPYLFLAECFYYALESAHNKAVIYRPVNSSPATDLPPGLEAWEGLFESELLEEELSPQFLSIVSNMTKKEIEIFLKLAELSIYDEDEDYYLYAPVTESEIALYKQFGIGNQEFLLMEEFGLVNLGARVDNIMEVNDEPAGFQNDHLVFYVITDQEPFEIRYKSYNFTSVGQKLLELLAIETNDYFFKNLTDIIVEQYQNLPIECHLVSVDDVEWDNEE